ncbi:MAG: GNAT family N-acetyltransferase [Steroidobacteraceae bacterium]
MAELLITSELLVAGEHDSVLKAWTELEPHCRASAFTSHHWIGNWLANLPTSLRLHKLMVRRDQQVVALGILARGRDGKWPLRRRVASLHATGSEQFDCIFVEQNGFLVRRGLEQSVIAAVLRHTFESLPNVEQFRFDALEEPDEYLRAARAERLIVSDSRMAAPYVDLASIRNAGGEYLDSLPKKARYAVRSARTAYAAQFGPLRVTPAPSVEAALEVFSRLSRLNTVRQELRGQESSFEREFFQKFHRSLIARTFASGFVELLTMTAGEVVVGHLYLFRHRNSIVFYQCGFDYRLLGARAQPGYAVLSLAIEHYLAAGCDAFDFLAEASLYKLRLAQATRDMTWLLFRRPTLRNKLEARARRWWRSACRERRG